LNVDDTTTDRRPHALTGAGLRSEELGVVVRDPAIRGALMHAPLQIALEAVIVGLMFHVTSQVVSAACVTF
jgi:hypothetical protein